jgi:hypothetical protein
MIQLGDLDQLGDFTNINQIILDKEVSSVNYYTLRGERVTFTRFVSSGVYLKETIYTDGTKDVTKIFMNE